MNELDLETHELFFIGEGSAVKACRKGQGQPTRRERWDHAGCGIEECAGPWPGRRAGAHEPAQVSQAFVVTEAEDTLPAIHG